MSDILDVQAANREIRFSMQFGNLIHIAVTLVAVGVGYGIMQAQITQDRKDIAEIKASIPARTEQLTLIQSKVDVLLERMDSQAKAVDLLTRRAFDGK